MAEPPAQKTARKLTSRIGRHVRSRRRNKRWTQQQLAHVSGVSTSRISLIERYSDGMYVNTLIALSLALETTANDLLGITKATTESMYVRRGQRHMAYLLPILHSSIDFWPDLPYKPKQVGGGL